MGLQQPVETVIGFAMILTAVPVYFVCIYWKSKPRWFSSSLENSTIALQRLLVVLPPDKED